VITPLGKSSKLERGFSSSPSLNISDSEKLNFPPNICIPSKAEMMINNAKSNSKLAIDFIEFINDITKFLNDDQYLIYNRTVQGFN
jgi:hypothetical protein